MRRPASESTAVPRSWPPRTTTGIVPGRRQCPSPERGRVTHWLVDAGYYTANIITMDGRRIGTGKTDLNFEVEGEVLRPGELMAPKVTREWARQDFADSVRLFHATDWAGLKRHQPLLAQVNFPNVERGGGKWINNDKNPKYAEPAQVTLPPYHPDTPAVRHDWASYLDSVAGLDVQFGFGQGGECAKRSESHTRRVRLGIDPDHAAASSALSPQMLQLQ